MYNLDGEIPCLWVKTTAQYAGDVNLQALAPHEVLELADLLHSMYDDMMRNFPHKN